MKHVTPLDTTATAREEAIAAASDAGEGGG